MGFHRGAGDLAKLVMAAGGAREMLGGRPALADCLWSVLVLAHHHDVNLAAAFRQTMDELDTAISAELRGPSATE